MTSAPRQRQLSRRAPRVRWRRHSTLALRRRHGGYATLVAVALLCLIPPGAARGDGDPASDVLLIQNAFYPYQPSPPPRLEAALNALLSQARNAGMPLKVAIVGSREDLGAVPTYFGHPEQYAAFLDREISYSTKTPQPLLVVMPAGFGLAAAAPASALARVSIDTGAGTGSRTAGLTRAAILAVSALARANGHALAAPASAGLTTTKRGGPPSAILFGLPVLLLVLAGAPILARRRRKASRQTAPRGHSREV